MDAVYRELLMRGGLEGGSNVSSNLIKQINFQVPITCLFANWCISVARRNYFLKQAYPAMVLLLFKKFCGNCNCRYLYNIIPAEKILKNNLKTFLPWEEIIAAKMCCIVSHNYYNYALYIIMLFLQWFVVVRFGYENDPYLTSVSELFDSYDPEIGFGGIHGRGRRKQDPPIERELYLTLEEVFKGCVKKMKISRRVSHIKIQLTPSNSNPR